VRVAVFGATGVVGGALLPALAGDHEVVAVSRRPRPDEGGVRWTQADVLSAEDVAGVLAGADVAYYLVHSLGARDFERQDRDAARNVAARAEEAGVRQLVYLGGLGAEGPAASPHLRSRHETGELLAAGAVPVTTLRAAIIVGRGSAGFETIRALVDRLPAMVTPAWVATPTQPIALRDVVRYLAAVCGDERTFGEAYDAGGPEVLTYREMIDRVARARGRRPPIVEVPLLTPWLSSLWLHLVTPVRASVARPLIEGLRNPTVAREQRLRELYPFELTPFDDAVREALAG
jgi:uncharacterized protein YbjT (DUF2867 family)